jgi:hypothetical protein
MTLCRIGNKYSVTAAICDGDHKSAHATKFSKLTFIGRMP